MNWLVAGLLLVSGATGLIYEVVWAKVLSDVFGNSGEAHAVVLATFMGGLALGAALFGGLADRLRRPIVLYAGIELFIGLYALAFPFIFEALRGVYLGLAPGLDGLPKNGLRLGLAAISLLPPTVAMGGTMPAMLKHALARAPDLRAMLARLYAVNSFGAAAGAWMAGTLWIPSTGLLFTSRAAAVLNIGVGLVGLAMARLPDAVQPEATGATASPAPEDDDITEVMRRVALLGLFVSGFSSMVYETGWIRVLTLVVGGSTYAFTWIVCAFIFGIALGSAWVSSREDRGSLRLFGWLQLGLAASVLLTIPLFVRVPWLYLTLKAMIAPKEYTFPLFQVLVFLISALVMLLPTFLMGAGFPVAARVVTAGQKTAGRRLGSAWAANTVGTVLGSLGAGLWIMPTFGLEALFVVAILLTAASAIAALWATQTPWFTGWLAPAATAGATVLLLVLMSGWALTLALLSPVRRDPLTENISSHAAYLAVNEGRQTPLFIRHDAFATVLVGQSKAGKAEEGKNPTSHRFLQINGKPDASTGPGDAVTQIMLGQLGILVAPGKPERALLVGTGAGMSLAAMLTHPVKEVDLVEISPAVNEAARDWFGEFNKRALENERVRLHVDDARSFLALASGKYQVIVSEPSNPWVSGVSSLFTLGFFDHVKARLADDGVFVQWIHTYETSEALLKLVARTLLARFEHVTAWDAGGGDLLMVASRQPLTPDFAEVARRLEKPEVAEQLRTINVEGVAGLLSMQRMSHEDVVRWAGQGVLNTDDLNHLEYRAPVAFFAGQRVKVFDGREHPRSHPRLLLSRYLQERPLDAVSARQIARAVNTGKSDGEGVLRSSARAWYRVQPEDPEAQAMLAEQLWSTDEPELALGVLPGPRTPALASAWVSSTTLARMQRQSPWIPLADVSEEASTAVKVVEGMEEVQSHVRRLCSFVTCPPRP